MSTDGYIAWAEFWCPEPVRAPRAHIRVACAAYDEADNRIGDDAEHDDLLTRILWLETAIRLARVGWRITELEDARWPVGQRANVAALIRSGV